MKTIHIHTDGKATPNPGVATGGFVALLKQNDTKIDEFTGMFKLPGKGTNNDAEYIAALSAMSSIQRVVKSVGPESEWANPNALILYTDSELMFSQNVHKSSLYTGAPRKRKIGERRPKFNSRWAAKTYNTRLKGYKRQMNNIMFDLRIPISFCLVPREMNQEADLLTNIAMDELIPGNSRFSKNIS